MLSRRKHGYSNRTFPWIFLYREDNSETLAVIPPSYCTKCQSFSYIFRFWWYLLHKEIFLQSTGTIVFKFNVPKMLQNQCEKSSRKLRSNGQWISLLQIDIEQLTNGIPRTFQFCFLCGFFNDCRLAVVSTRSSRRQHSEH